jgi:protein gp37
MLTHLRNVPAAVRFVSYEPALGAISPDLTGIHWVICGGESGPGARPMHPDWARSLRDQCNAAGVAFFMKQMGGARKPFEPIPDDLMIREHPHA